MEKCVFEKCITELTKLAHEKLGQENGGKFICLVKEELLNPIKTISGDPEYGHINVFLNKGDNLSLNRSHYRLLFRYPYEFGITGFENNHLRQDGYYKKEAWGLMIGILHIIMYPMDLFQRIELISKFKKLMSRSFHKNEGFSRCTIKDDCTIPNIFHPESSRLKQCLLSCVSSLRIPSELYKSLTRANNQIRKYVAYYHNPSEEFNQELIKTFFERLIDGNPPIVFGLKELGLIKFMESDPVKYLQLVKFIVNDLGEITTGLIDPQDVLEKLTLSKSAIDFDNPDNRWHIEGFEDLNTPGKYLSIEKSKKVIAKIKEIYFTSEKTANKANQQNFTEEAIGLS